MEEKVKDIIEDVLNIIESELSLKTSFYKDLGADSLDLVEIIMQVENEFDIEILDEKIERIETVGDIVELIKELRD